ncbi:hypothetical protein ACE7GA_13160 [Roseomonas sp. CCTCC AB2023176]|uniref:hypothetical protein n=1 Tax=Roseomonas sp. CCTCC AB2023176 TaxID=3342640 RepID=UPI0035DC0E2A
MRTLARARPSPSTAVAAALSGALRRTRPSTLLPVALSAPLLGLALGFAWPEAGLAVRQVLGAVVLVLVFAAVASTEFGRPTRAEATATARLLLAACVAAPVVVALVAHGIALPADLALGAVLAAAGPVSIGASVIARRFGRPARPVVWGAVGGLILSPVLVPLAVTIGGWSGPPPAELARQAALVGVGPVAAALLLRRAAPKATEAASADLRGLVVLTLVLLACSAGGKAATALDAWGAWPAAVAGATLLVSACAAWVVGVVTGGAVEGRALAVGACLRNNSLVWAAALAAGGLPARAEAVMALFLAGTFLVTFGLLIVARGRAVR